MPSPPDAAPGARRPAVVFAFRFGNEDGFVQRFFAHHRDLAARMLQPDARSLFAFAQLGPNPAHVAEWATEVKADFFDYAPANRDLLARLIRADNLKVVVFQGADLGEVDLGFLHGLGVRTINTEDSSYVHTRTQAFPVWAAKFVLRSVLKRGLHDLHIVNSEGNWTFFTRFAGFPASRMALVRPGIDHDYHRPGDRAAACRRLGLDPEIVWIMAAAQSRAEKRVDLLVDAVRRIKDARPDMRVGFFYVGDGLLMQQWREAATRALGADCRFFGKQTGLQTYYQAASLFIHGAVKESFGLVIAEAMASGLPVVATTAHGPAEIIRDGVTGFVVGQNDWDGFVAAALRYLDDPSLRQAHGAAGRLRCIENYSSDRAAAELADLIRSRL